MIPSRFGGVWRRISIALGDAPPAEAEHVVWLQGRSAFADLRLPRSGPGEATCFAGHTSGTEGHLCWEQDVGLVAPGFPDEGDVAWEGDTLVERGHFVIDGRALAYVERWHREDGGGGPSLSLVRRTPAVSGRILVVGDHALSIVDDRSTGGGFGASYRRRAPLGPWKVVRRLGAGAPEPPDGRYRFGEEVQIAGAPWVVDEAPCER